MTRADLVVRGATVVTVDPERRVLSPGTVVVAEDRVVAVDADADLTGTQAIRTIDARGKVVIPGLVNAHSHNLHILMRGGPSDFTLHLGVLDWTLNALDPSMRAHSRADVRLAAQLYCLEAIRSGITTTAENMDYS